jgi:integrase
MANLVRPRIVRYLDKDGKRVKKGAPDACRVKERARKWYAEGVPGWPKGKRVPLASDKTVARQILSDLVRKAERGEAGLEDETTEARKRPLAEHLADFEAALRNKPRGVSDKQVKQTLQRVRDAFDACGFARPSDIRPDPVLAWLAQRRKPAKKDGGLSIQTSNFYLAAVSQFCKWMASPLRRRLPANPFAGIERGNVKLGRRHDRRNLKPTELAHLLAVVKSSERTFRGLTGEDRHWLYHTSCGTGFSRGELACLSPESFDLDAGRPTVTLPAAQTKNKKPVVQPLPSCLAAALRDYLMGKPRGERVWPGTWTDCSADMLKEDLAEADIPYEAPGPNGPLFADFHALRHTYVTMLGQAGVGVK